MCGLAININSFSHLLKRTYFNAVVDHLALKHIIKSKAKLAPIRVKTIRTNKLIFIQSILYQRRDMLLSDFLSRQKHDNSNPHEIIPISFNMQSTLHDKYYNIGNLEIYFVQTWSQAKSSEINLPEVHGASKGLNLDIQPKKTGLKTSNFKSKRNSTNKNKVRTRESRIKMQKPQITHPIVQSVRQLVKIPEMPKA